MGWGLEAFPQGFVCMFQIEGVFPNIPSWERDCSLEFDEVLATPSEYVRWLRLSDPGGESLRSPAHVKPFEDV